MVGKILSIHNGRYFFNYAVPIGSVGFKVGEFAFTKQWKGTFIHRHNKSELKREKLRKQAKQASKNKGRKGGIKGGHISNKKTLVGNRKKSDMSKSARKKLVLKRLKRSAAKNKKK
jgi:hypothetical protein